MKRIIVWSSSLPLMCVTCDDTLAVILLLFNHCACLLPLFEFFFVRPLLCLAVLCVLSSFAIILLGSKELVALLLLCSECHHVAVIVFLMVTWVCMQYLIVTFPCPTHLLFTKVLTDLLHTSLLHCTVRAIFTKSCTLHYDLSVHGDLLWALFKRGDVSSNWNLSFSSATKYYIFCPEIFFYLNKQCIPR